jgi:antitoxin component HigA of HigAB toxin-antitoxin module
MNEPPPREQRLRTEDEYIRAVELFDKLWSQRPSEFTSRTMPCLIVLIEEFEARRRVTT